MYEREGGLRLCECGHPLSYHPEQYEWYFHEGASEACKAAPLLPPSCVFCDCKAPREGAFQGFVFLSNPHSLK